MFRQKTIIEIIKYFTRPDGKGVKLFVQGNEIVLLSLEVDHLLGISDTDIEDGMIHEWIKPEFNQFFALVHQESIDSRRSITGHEYWTARALSTYAQLNFKEHRNTLPIVSEWINYQNTVRSRCNKTGRYVSKWHEYDRNKQVTFTP
jgi:hypothetical protein